MSRATTRAFGSGIALHLFGAYLSYVRGLEMPLAFSTANLLRAHVKADNVQPIAI